MVQQKERSETWKLLLACCLLSVLAACGQPVGAANATTAVVQEKPQGSITPAATNVQKTVAMPPTETTCPAENTARAAVTRPLHLGTDPTVVYVYNQVPPNTSTAFGRLIRVNVGPAQSTEIVNSGLSIQWAQVSADGQWVLFLSTPDPRGDRQHSAMLQLVRLDGQGLQTLYCIPNTVSNNSDQTTRYLPNVQWSEDQKTILINTDTKDTTSTIIQLNPATGQLKTLLNITDPQQLYRYSLLTWLDNDRVYILKSGRQGPPPPVTLYLLDTRTSHDIKGGDLKKVLESESRLRNLSFDSSYDGKKLFFSNCLMASNPFDQTISVGPASGGNLTSIYHAAPTVCVSSLRIGASKDHLFMVGVQTDSQEQSFTNMVWRLGTDGKGWQTLYGRPRPKNQYEYFSLNVYTQFPWSDFSRDGEKFTFLTKNFDTGVQRLLYTTVNGGQPHGLGGTPVGEKNSSLYMVGWTTY